MPYLVIHEDQTLGTLTEIDEADAKEVNHGMIDIVKFEHDSWWQAYIDENDNVCWEEITE